MTRLRRGWWLTGKTVPGAVAGAGSIVVVSLFFLTPATRRLGDPLTMVVVWLLAAMAVIGVIAGAASVRALRRHPTWVVAAANPLTPRMCRRLWVLGVAGGAVVVIGLVASMWVHSLAVTVVQFVALVAAGGALSLLGRRAVSLDPDIR